MKYRVCYSCIGDDDSPGYDGHSVLFDTYEEACQYMFSLDSEKTISGQSWYHSTYIEEVEAVQNAVD